jgi:hypothetical protein
VLRTIPRRWRNRLGRHRQRRYDSLFPVFRESRDPAFSVSLRPALGPESDGLVEPGTQLVQGCQVPRFPRPGAAAASHPQGFGVEIQGIFPPRRPLFFLLRLVVGYRGKKALWKEITPGLPGSASSDRRISNQIRCTPPAPLKLAGEGAASSSSTAEHLASQHQGRLPPTEQAIGFDELLSEESTLSAYLVITRKTRFLCDRHAVIASGVHASDPKPDCGEQLLAPRAPSTPLMHFWPKKKEVVLGRLP